MNHHVLCDTDILIDYSRGVAQAATILESLERTSIITISLITQMELLIGCKNKRELQHVEKFISRFNVQRINHEISDCTIVLLREYRLSHGLMIADAFIAATALVLDLLLLTKNYRDFSFIPGIILPKYPSTIIES